MSRADRERWAMGAEQWPHLQDFISSRLAESLFEETDPLVGTVQSEIADLDVEQKAQIATECWMFMSAFRDRHDDRQFIRDGFGAHGWIGNDDRGRGQTGLDRLKLVYGALAASIRRVDPDWRPNR
ncbi:MAG: hypothetical protein V4523_17910 [Pseudomonadota bacterium]